MPEFFRRTPALLATLGCSAALFPASLSADECAAPNYTCVTPRRSCYAPQEAVQQAAPGMYQQPPATGEFEGESSGLGIRGFGFTLPAIHCEGATIRLPRLFKSKSPARMRTDSQIAPYVSGPAAQFGYLPTVPVNAAQQQAAPAQQQTAPEYCVPPAPPCSSSTERQLRNELAQKDAEIRLLQERFGELEEAVNRLGETPARSIPTRAAESESTDSDLVESEREENQLSSSDRPRPDQRRLISTRVKVREKTPSRTTSQTQPTKKRPSSPPEEKKLSGSDEVLITKVAERQAGRLATQYRYAPGSQGNGYANRSSR